MRKIAQIILGLGLAFAGTTHLGANRAEFQAQVPSVLKDYADFVVLASGVVVPASQDAGMSQIVWSPMAQGVLKDYADFVVLASGVVEILLGLGLIIVWKYRVQFGWAVAAFFVAIFWGNISQYVNGVDAFGLNSDAARATRLLFQPLLVIWALWSTGAWRARRSR